MEARMNAPVSLWDRYQTHVRSWPTAGLSVDISRMRFDQALWDRMAASMNAAFDAMDALEHGAIANPDEGRMVGHYWLRAPELAPSAEIREAVTAMQARVIAFSRDVHQGVVKPEKAPAFRNVLVIGIGGSALGPQLAASALGSGEDRMRMFFFDNTDPDGFDRVLGSLGDGIKETLTVVISKSGGTKETRNGMLEAKEAYRRAGLAFGSHAVAVTGDGSDLYKVAKAEKWVATFPMWDWVGGRTSEFSAVGLVPAALQGIDTAAMLDGAREADALGRNRDPKNNPAALLALMWHVAGGGSGKKNMVILPYKDRLELTSRYLQQLVMESLGKQKDLTGTDVHQGLTVYGNKGSTDQHAFVQQLRDGRNDFFVTFIRIIQERRGRAPSFEVEPGITSGDYLEGFLLGTRQALFENGRDSLMITLDDLGPRSLGVLLAVFERAVGLYASLIGVNAYHQPGVEAGKKAAARVIDVQHKIVEVLRAAQGREMGVDEIAGLCGAAADPETVWHVLDRLSRNPGRGVERSAGGAYFEAKFRSA
jgi:glucose-6-phosphate isomerase